MIYDTLALIARHAGAIPRFDRVADFLRRDFAALPDGRVEIDGDDVFATISRYETKPMEEGLFESHDRYVDIQFVLEGEERCGVAAESDRLGVAVPYDAGKDLRFLARPAAFATLHLRPGLFAAFWHGDAHLPGRDPGAPPCGGRGVRKCIVKVRA